MQLESLVSGGDKFFTKILAHERLAVEAEVEVDATENENFLRNLFEENHDQICKGASLAVELLPFGKWAKLLMKGGINLAAVDADRNIKDKDKLDEKLEDLFYTYDSKNNWGRFSAEQKLQEIEKVIVAYSKQNISQDKSDNAELLLSQLDEIQERAKKSKRMNGKDDMTATLNADIEILRDITAKAVINAIGLERAFNSVITKNVNLINR
ncbi:MAG: hypothetical protein IJP68_09705, partial [Selenomonadaceae bacterium]|nr:hypothetical protein [Selenomonadaceae bacterium]